MCGWDEVFGWQVLNSVATVHKHKGNVQNSTLTSYIARQKHRAIFMYYLLLAHYPVR